MVDDMLLVARAENPATQVARTPLDLRELCEGLAAFYQIAADERALRIEVSGEAVALGDADLVRRGVDSTPGAMTMFWLRFPAAAA